MFDLRKEGANMVFHPHLLYHSSIELFGKWELFQFHLQSCRNSYTFSTLNDLYINYLLLKVCNFGSRIAQIVESTERKNDVYFGIKGKIS